MSTLSTLDLSALILIDAQERLCAAMQDFANSTGRRLVQMVAAAELLGVNTIVTEQYPKGLGHTIPSLRDVLSPVTPVLAKQSFSCWGSELFVNAVQIIRPRTLVLVGMETHVCVQQTALQALNHGYRVVVPADAVCSRCDYDRAISLALMRDSGITVTTVEALVFDWLQDARHPKFKEVSARFK